MTDGYGDEPNGRRPPTRAGSPAWAEPSSGPADTSGSWRPPRGTHRDPGDRGDSYLDADEFAPSQYVVPPMYPSTGPLPPPEAYEPTSYQPDPYRTGEYRPSGNRAGGYPQTGLPPESDRHDPSRSYPPDRYQPDRYQPEAYQPDRYRPEAYPPDPYQPSGYSPPRYDRGGAPPPYREPGYDERRPYRPAAGVPSRSGPLQGRGPDPYAPDGYPLPTAGYPPPRPSDRYPDTGRGDSRSPVPRDPARPVARPAVSAPPERRRTGLVVAGVIAVILLILGVGFAIVESRGGESARTPNASGTEPEIREILDQKVDPVPLSDTEVFGTAKITSTAPGKAAYKVVKSQAATDCGTAVTGTISTLLTSLGCTQVIRGTILSPDGAYVITAGVFNMPDAKSASKAHGSIKSAVDTRKGRFSGFAAGGSTDVIAQAATHLAWDTRGHYLLYAVIALTNGKAITATDARTPLIVTDVLERYLSDTVIGGREARLASPSASAS